MSTQTSERTVIDSVNKQLFIGGEWRDAKEGGTLSVEDPATSESLCEVADAQRKDALALLMTLEMGKPVADSKAEITYASEFFRWYSEQAVRIGGTYSISPDGAQRIMTMKQPVGPCLMITPWNFPMAMGTRKIGPAIAAGCTMVMKPAKQTPLSMLALARILEEAGLPGGVLNVLTSSSSGSVMEPLIKDPRARKLSFTGSTEVGRKLIEQAAEQ